MQNEVLDYLLAQERADPNLPNREGDSALHMAAANGQTHSLRLLLKHHADTSTHSRPSSHRPG